VTEGQGIELLEYVDVVDSNNHVIGKETHRRVHDVGCGVWHRSVHVFLFDKSGNLFVQRRGKKRRLAPGKWDCSVGEHVKSGERVEQGARRGLKEELGVGKIKLKKRWTKKIQDVQKKYSNREFSTLFVGIWNGRIELSEESETGKWMELKELKKWVRKHPTQFTPMFREHFKEWLKHHGNA